MSPAQRHRERVLAQTSAIVIPADVSGRPRAADSAAAQMALRLTHDLRRLHEIQSVERKIEAKREMLPEYRPWVEGVLAANAGVPDGVAAEIVPTVMVWLIDTGSFADALPVAEFVLRHGVAMPSRYSRAPAAVLVEEVANAAAKAQALGQRFPIEILAAVDELTAHADMHDQVRAKLAKAIGVEQLELAAEFDGQAERTLLEAALSTLRRAQTLHDRVGAKDRIRRIEKQLSAAPETAAPAA